MFSPKVDAPLAVRVPSAAEDHPSWLRVGVIAAIGFIAGVVWPRVAGVRLGPAVPESALSSPAPAAEPNPQAPPERVARAIEGTPQAGSPPAPAVLASAASTAGPAVSAASPAVDVAVSVTRGAIFACKTSDGDSLKGSACGTLPGLDGLLMPRLRKLAECPEAAAATGVFHLIVHPDFGRGSVGVELGRGQGVSSPESLLACAKANLASASVAAIPHDNPRYSVSYRVTFGAGAPADVPASPRPEVTPATARAESASAPTTTHAQRTAEETADPGTAQIVWDVALVRDAPKTGKVVARLPRGSSVRVGPVKEAWYPVQYGDGFAADGWVYRGALGR